MVEYVAEADGVPMEQGAVKNKQGGAKGAKGGLHSCGRDMEMRKLKMEFCRRKGSARSLAATRIILRLTCDLCFRFFLFSHPE